MINIVRKEEQLLSTWSGGTTRQIYIYPEGSDYPSRQFDFRLSSATVDCESSTFTPLPGIHRHLMILEGTLELVHLDRYKKNLEILDQDEFEGDWQTLSFGKVVDFNLMLKRGSGKIWGIDGIVPGPLFLQNEITELSSSSHPFFYLHQGELGLGEIVLRSGDFITGMDILQMQVLKASSTLIGVKGTVFTA